MNNTIPDPFPDEIFYSILGRMSEWLGFSSQRRFIANLFGNGNVIATLELPSHIAYFLSTLPSDSYFKEESTIYCHTLYPYYSAFLPAERAENLRQDMLGNNGPSTHFRSGMMASSVTAPSFMQFCPQCVMDEKEIYGECYWHRLHQLPGVLVCPTHNVMLIKSETAIRNKESRLTYIPAERSITPARLSTCAEAPCTDERLLKVAKDSQTLLNNRHGRQGEYSTFTKYQGLLYKQGYCNYTGRFEDFNRLIFDFVNYYGEDLLKLFGCNIDPSMTDNWLYRLVHRSISVQHPLQHLLFIQFLGLSASEFFGYSVPKPFGDPPWPCLNKICRFYREPVIRVISTYTSKYTNGKPIGVFACDCGFVYRRTGPDTCVGDRFRIDKILSFGVLWQEKLSELWANSSFSLREIARMLGVDPITVKRQAQKLHLQDRENSKLDKNSNDMKCSSCNVLQSEVRTSRLVVNRNEWLKIMAENPGVGIKGLRAIKSTVYFWLYKNDREWLSDNYPMGQKRVSQHKRIDWEERDKSLSSLIEPAAIKVRMTPGKPVRVTISTIGREIGKLALIQKHIDRLPITNEVLNRFVESLEEFAIRRIHWIASLFVEERVMPLRWQLIRRAGVAKQLANLEVIEVLEHALKQIESKVGMMEI